jgi:uncharacterized protein (DUF1778 family)
MATDKPRITITLDPDDYAVIKRLAALQGGTMSRIVKELVQTVTPSLARVADVLEHASGAEQEVLNGLAAAVASSEQPVLDTLHAAEAAYASFLDDAEAVAAGNPPSSNTGGRSLTPHPSSPSPKGSD